MNKDNFLVFPLVSGQKIPCCKWKEYNYKLKKYTRGNQGLIPAINDCCVIDIDFIKHIPDAQKRQALIEKDPLMQLLKKQTPTYTVITPTGGLHYYFKADEDFNFTVKHMEHIDIIYRDSYVVAPGSFIPSKKGFYKETILEPIRPMSDELKQYILSIPSKKTTIKKTPDGKQYVSKQSYLNDFDFNMTEEEVKEVVQSLPKEFCEQRDKWLYITVALKTLNKKHIWEEWSRSCPGKYNSVENNQTWNTVEPNQNMVFHMINVAKSHNKTLKFSGGYKKVETDLKHPVDVEMNKRFLPKTTIKPKHNYLIKSDKGTGKSTCFLSYCQRALKRNPKQKFISIVTRCALGKEQYRKAQEALDIPITYYKDLRRDFRAWRQRPLATIEPPIWTFQFLITTPESYASIFDETFCSIDLEEFIVFVDEFNSVIDHLVTSSTLEQNRVMSFDRVVQTISRCQQLICADADISPVCEQFLDKLDKPFQYVLNTYQPFKDVPVTFCDDLKLFIGQIVQAYNEQTPFFVMCDSKKNAEKIHSAIKHKGDIQLYVSKNDYEEEKDDNDIDLQNTNYGIASPKIVYGLDSNRKGQRVVFAYYNGNTISPPQMVQQITRERQPKEVHIFYDNPITKQAKFGTIKDTGKLIKKASLTFKMAMLDALEIEQVIDREDFYCELLTYLEYTRDSYETSKYLHLRSALEESGFVINNTFATIHQNTSKSKSGLMTTKTLFKTHNENFKEALQDGTNNIELFLSKYRLEIGDVSNDDEICNVFANNDLLKQFKIWKLLQLNVRQLEINIDQLKDFESSKTLNHQKTRILFCIECMDYFKIDLNNIYYVPNNSPIDDSVKDKMMRYVGFINRWFKNDVVMTNSMLYTYFRKVITKLMPYGVFKTIKNEHSKTPIIHYNNTKQYTRQAKQNKMLNTFKRIQALQMKD